ncbi:hypothetical protein FRB91_003288 [Serendipita sp. 411]|nr:hypothetical protein FRB91_003288 [Serendipita sp. 411]
MKGTSWCATDPPELSPCRGGFARVAPHSVDFNVMQQGINEMLEELSRAKVATRDSVREFLNLATGLRTYWNSSINP